MPGSDCEIFLSPCQINAINHCWVFVGRPATLWVRPWRMPEGGVCRVYVQVTLSSYWLTPQNMSHLAGKNKKNRPRRPRLSTPVFQLRYCKRASVVPDVNNRIWVCQQRNISHPLLDNLLIILLKKSFEASHFRLTWSLTNKDKIVFHFFIIIFYAASSREVNFWGLKRVNSMKCGTLGVN